jgi:hypothetical protein
MFTSRASASISALSYFLLELISAAEIAKIHMNEGLAETFVPATVVDDSGCQSDDFLH